MIKRLDKDGDGKISAEEFEAMRRGGRGGRGGPGGKGRGGKGGEGRGGKGGGPQA